MATDFSMYSGDSKTLEITITDSDGVAVDLTGATVKYAIALSSTASAALVSKATGGSGITTASNVATVTLASADTATLAGVYYHEMEITTVLGAVTTAMTGTITILADVIQ